MSYYVCSSVGEHSGECEGSDLGESLGVDFLIEVGSSLVLSGGGVERKFDGSSVEIDRGFVGNLLLGAYAVAVSAVLARASALSSRVR